MTPEQEIISILAKLKTAVEQLVYHDDLLFDQDLGKIDLLVYRLRSLAIRPPPGTVAMSMEAFLEEIKELEKELEHEQRQKEGTGRTETTSGGSD